MPTNLYGPRDNFHLENSHVLPAMLRKIHLARLLSEGDWQGIRADLGKRPVEGVGADATEQQITDILARYGIHDTEVDLWGSGTPLREFLWSEDMADASVYILENIDFAQLKKRCEERGEPVRNCHINIGTGIEHTIAQTAEMVRQTVGFSGQVRWDATKPDGTLRKLCNVDKLHSLGWRHTVELDEGIRRLYDWYLASCNARAVSSRYF